jgi:hypothetical protein
MESLGPSLKWIRDAFVSQPRGKIFIPASLIDPSAAPPSTHALSHVVEVLKLLDASDNCTCRVCGELANATCKECAGPRYCSRACQRADWTARHKKECAAYERIVRLPAFLESERVAGRAVCMTQTRQWILSGNTPHPNPIARDVLKGDATSVAATLHRLSPRAAAAAVAAQMGRLEVRDEEGFVGTGIVFLSPLAAAAQLGYVDVVQVLLGYGADMEELPSGSADSPRSECSALVLAAMYGRTSVVRALLLNGALHADKAKAAAVANGHLECVQLFGF